MPVKIIVEVIGDNAEFAVGDLFTIVQKLQAAGVSPGQIVATAAGEEVRVADPLDGNTAKENALVLLRKHYETPDLRKHFKPLLDEFGIKAFGEIPGEKGVSFLTRVIEILRNKGVEV